MSRAANESRRELYIADVHHLVRTWETLGDQRNAGDRTQQSAIAIGRFHAQHIRETLSALVALATTDVRAAEAAAEFLCTAVRLTDSLFTPRERNIWYEAIVTKAADFQDQVLHGKLLGNFGNSLADAGRLEEAEAILQRRLQLAVIEKDLIGEVLGSEHLGKLFLRRGRFFDAAPLLQMAFEKAVERGDEAAVIRLLADRAKNCFRKGDVAAGVALMEDRIRRCEGNGDSMLLLSTHHTLAEQLMSAGRLEDAQRHAEKAEAIAKRLRLPSRRAAILGTLGDINHDRGQLDLARRYVMSARRIFCRLNNSSMLSNTATSLGLIDQKQGRLREAEKWHRRALDVDHALGRKRDEAIDLGNLAGVLVELGKLNEAAVLYERRLKLLALPDDQRRFAETQWALAKTHAQQGHLEEAVRLVAEALPSLGKFSEPQAVDAKAKLKEWQSQLPALNMPRNNSRQKMTAGRRASAKAQSKKRRR